MKIILVAVDFSAVTAAVAAQAVALARAFKARLVLLAVTQPPVITGDYSMMMENYTALIDVGEKATAKNLTRLQARLSRQGVVAEVIALTGSPARLIVEQAAKLGANWVVMGSHGHTAFYDLLIGSTTQGVLRRATCPVVVVPPPQADRRKT